MPENQTPTAEKDAPTRSVWSPGHMADCQRFPAGWLCNPACTVPASECATPPGVDQP